MSWDPVYRLVQQIPRGRVLSYGALARLLRLRGGARTAGRAIREPYASLQKKLLESEGVKITESRVDLKSHLWAPSGKSRPVKKQVKTPPRASRAKGRSKRTKRA